MWETGENGKTVKTDEKFKYIYFLQSSKVDSEGYTDIHGKPVIKRVTEKKDDMISVSKAGATTFETDLSEETKFLVERYAGKKLDADISNFNVCFFDIEIEVDNEFPDPKDVKYPINLITVKSSKTGKITTFGNRPYNRPSGEGLIQDYYYCPDEETFFKAFVTWFRKQKFDIVTGWNSNYFDIPYIINRCNKIMGEEFTSKLSQLNKLSSYDYGIPGLSKLDYLDLYKNFIYEPRASYSLDYIGNVEVGEGKLEFEGQIHNIYKTDWEQFVDYNIQDVLLVEKIDAKLKLIQTAITFAYETLTPLERIQSSVAVITGAFMKYLRKDKMVMPDKTHKNDWWFEEDMFKAPDGKIQNWLTGESSTAKTTSNRVKKINNGFIIENHVKGGHVEAHRGFYKHNLSFDITSSYPHQIIKYNISPETKIVKPSEQMIKEMNLIKSTINGVYYTREEGILPKITKYFFNQRKMFKKKMFESANNGDSAGKAYYNNLQMIYKILINSMYGVLANEHFHFHDIDNARAITRGGRTCIRYLGDSATNYFHNYWHKVAKKYFPDTTFGNDPKDRIDNRIVCVIDTDSTYLCLDQVYTKTCPEMPFGEFAKIMDEVVLQPLYEKILDVGAKEEGVEQVIEFKREGVILKQFVMAKKKYLTELLQNEDIVYDPPKIKATGVEIVRSDTPVFNQEKIQIVVKDIFDNLDKDGTIDLIKEIKKDFKSAVLGDIGTVKGVKEYTKYAYTTEELLKTGLKCKNRTPIHTRASICYHYMIKRFNLPYMEISNGAKVKFIHVKENNLINTNVIAFIGNFPEEVHEHFKIDYDTHYQKTFLSPIQRMFDVLDWGEITLKKNALSGFLKKKK